MPPDDRVRLRHMIEMCEAAIGFVTDRQRHDLDSDTMLALALVRAIEIVGEAAARMSAATRDRYGAVPWALIVGMRNRLIHAYFDIDNDIIWNSATRDIPALLITLRRIEEGL